MADEEVKQEETQKEETEDAKGQDDALQKMTAELTEAREEKQTLAAKLDELTATIKQEKERSKDALEPVDDALVDPKVIRNLEKLYEQHGRLEVQVKEQAEKISKYEAKEAEIAKAEQIKSVTEKILKPLDETYGAKYRDAAYALADKMVQKGEARAPGDALDGYLLLEKCYRQLKAKEDAASPKAPVTDSGFGGIPFNDSKITTGSRADILAEIKKHGLTKAGAEPVL
jgi:hypothetical protein